MIKLLDFKTEDFVCKCGCGANDMQDDFLTELQDFRTYMHVPFVINSAFRCKDWNRKCGGKPDSMHLKGRAVDLSTRMMTGEELHKFILIAVGRFMGVGIAKHYIHIDNREKMASWVYPV